MPTRYSGMTYWEMINRQLGVVSKNKQKIFKNSKATVIGCGGIGGSAIEMLARMGIGNLNIVDLDVFDMSNLNRQVMSSFHNIGLEKSITTKEKIAEINPFTKVTANNEGINKENVESIIKGSSFIIDALDNIESRVILSRECEKEEIPFIHGAIHGPMGQMTVFNNEDYTYEGLFNLPSYKKDLDKEVIKSLNNMENGIPPSIGPVPNIIGCLQAMEGFKLVTGEGSGVIAPKVLTFNLMSDNPFKIIEF